jgi:hypothetical protein
MEFGLGEALPLYAGGLGILAGDFLKTASDLGLPVIGIGLLFQAHPHFLDQHLPILACHPPQFLVGKAGNQSTKRVRHPPPPLLSAGGSPQIIG